MLVASFSFHCPATMVLNGELHESNRPLKPCAELTLGTAIPSQPGCPLVACPALWGLILS